MNKIFWSVVLGVVVLLVIAVVIVGFFLGDIAKKGVETIGPKITQVPVKVNAVDLSLLTGTAAVKGFILGNPDGYKTSEAISIGTAQVGIDPFSVFSKKIHIRTVHVESPEITFEGGLGGNNLSTILDNINSANKQQVQAGATPASTNQPAAAPAKKYQVDDFLITGAKVHVSLTGMGGQELTLDLPDIHLTQLGTDADGITATDLSRRIMDSIFSETIKAVASSASGVTKGAENLTSGAAKSVTKSIGNLFGK